MDSLDHMLTDPLELGPCGDGHSPGIMEDCLLGGTRVSLPEDLLEDPEIFFDVVSLSTWQEVLSDSQREHLQQFLPRFPADSVEQQSELILALFSGENFRFGNPLHIAQKLFRDGHFNPEVVKYRQLCFKSQYKRYLNSQQQYFHRLLKQILASRSDLLEMARRSGPALPFPHKHHSPSRSPEEREWRTQQRYLKVLREVKEECGDTALSSDEEATLDLQEKFSFEDLSSWLPSSPARSPSPAVPLRVVPTLSTTDMKTADKIELGDSDLKLMLKKHHEKRKHQPDHPDLLTGDLTLSDIMTRVNAGRKGSLAALYDLAVLKKKVKEKEEKKKKKIKLIKSEAEDLAEPLSNTEGVPTLSQAPSPLAISSIKEEPLEDIKPCLGINEISSSFFSLLLEILLLESQASLPMLEDRVLDWQSSPASSLNSWFSAAPNWAELVLPALQYLAGESRAVPSSFSPFVEFKEKTQQWKLLGQSQDNEKELAALFHLWLETKDQAFCKQENEDSSDAMTPVPRVRTDYVVRPSTGEEKRVFQEQERYRYSQPHKAFTFRMHGFESVVGPVKGVFDKETSLNKAREHSLLRSDRPAYVTILSLVRDAAARLPNGEGTRAEICELLKDSQFLAPDVTSTQVNTVVSGALDRLHYEKDPCVKYDIGRKLWIYLHRDRSEEEFERIHQAQAAAAKARKALQQKPKPPSKVKSSNKEGSTKGLSGPSEQSQMSLSDSSMPPTPVTPVTPTTPALPTPISPPPVSAVNRSGSTTVSEPAKSSSGVLLVSSPTMPQLGTMLSPASIQTPPSSQATARVVSHSSSAGLPQVRVVAQPSLPAVSQQSVGPAQPLPQMPAGPQIRVPVTATQTKVVPQAVMATVPVKGQTAAASVQRPGPGQTGLTVTNLPAAVSPVSKTAMSSPGNSAPSASTTAVIQNVTGQNIIKQVSITGQLGVKPQTGSSIPLTATNFRIQGKDVLRLPPSSITTDAKGQTVLRITPDMMATLAKSQVTTVKLTQDLFGAGSGTSGKGISATLHVTSNPVHAADSPAKAPSASVPSSAPAGTTVVKVTPELKPTETSNSAFRLMPALGVSVADQKGKNTVASSEAKPAATIRIVQGLGVMPPKAGQTITVAAHAKQGASVAGGSGTVHSSTVSLPSINAAVSKTVAVASGATSTPISIGTGAPTVRQVPVNTTVVSTSQSGKLPTRITVPLSVISQPMKGKSVVTAPIIKGNLGANLSGLGRNIILTTMPAGTKLIAGNKPVSFLTAQQLQQLQQQGQATQVRIQTVPASHLQQGTASGSSKAVSTVVVTTAPSPKQAPEQQ
ncbi:nuclear factor related to kappa-B-binding protein isoform X1 [Mus caroli]|uniref:Nuclear factor related to kappa-B-binding protein n=2 Tax=Mus caroli TaxID=10089 RepID=A0A6P7RBY2_MUSCR|nr:nuclear factor related to kappa-B-binding protein isoform X1 [Mus caroli]XP_029337056.1 nuclear factor related to kappa-B-binding protein isoform X1 [Mus caroli]XP_029337057.1 nuclear factor related to kappa-B-binding protein isoform X1 [Mus caroli]